MLDFTCVLQRRWNSRTKIATVISTRECQNFACKMILFGTWKNFRSSSLRNYEEKRVLYEPRRHVFALQFAFTYFRMCVNHAGSRLSNTTFGLLRRKRRLYLTKRGPTVINRIRETTKRAAVLLPRELLDTPLANGSRRPARLLLLLLLEKST